MKVTLLEFPALLSLALLFPGQVDAQKGDLKSSVPDRYRSISVNQNTTNRTLVNVGQVAMWIFSNGQSARGPAGHPGFFFPRGSNPATAVVFQDQLIWGGQVLDGDQPLVRVGGGQYAVGHVPGKILSPGVAEDRTDPNIDRVWRVRRDFTTADLQQDAAEFNDILASQVTQAQIDQVRNIYRQDWIDWPAERGAPFYDADGDSQYNPAFNADGTPKLAPNGNETYDPAVHADEPGLVGADQVVWLVTNDLDVDSLAIFSGSPPIGLEQQITLFAFARADELGQIIFKRFRLIYKGTLTTPIGARIDSLYLCQWSDPDIGSFNDDLAGCDTGLDLGFVYKSSHPENYWAVGLPPPAVGYDVLAGPAVPDAKGQGIFDFELRSGIRNLPMTSFAAFSPGSQTAPSPLANYNATLQWWNLLRGFLPRPESPAMPFIDPTTDQLTKFMFSGDPLTGTGWVDLDLGDRKIVIPFGPVNMALGDTQEVVIATIVAIGTDRLTSISAMKFVDRAANQFLDNLVRGRVEAPSLSLQATGLDRKVVLSWPDIRASVDTRRGYEFEGYNIYQGESAVGPWHRIATFDKINNIETIFDERFDPETGVVINLPVQFGRDSGVQHFIEIREDVIDDDGLINGRAYYFGGSSYLYRADNEPNALESVIATVQVLPIGKNFSLSQNYPNPFNPETTIHFQLPQAGHVMLRIFNTLGQEIQKLADREFEAGFYRLVWDGKGARGRAASSGLYFYQLQAGDFIQVKKMMLLR